MPTDRTSNQLTDISRPAHETQGDRVVVRGTHNKVIIEMWVNTKTKIIETAYPLGKSIDV
jgi:hypothetical protein